MMVMIPSYHALYREYGYPVMRFNPDAEHNYLGLEDLGKVLCLLSDLPGKSYGKPL